MYGIALAVLAGLTLFLLLAVLGSMRETVLLRGEVEALSQLIKSPPPPSFVGGTIPDDLRQLVESTEPATPASSNILVAFLSPGCTPCEAIAAGLTDAVGQGQVSPSDLLSVVVWDHSGGSRRFASRLPGHVMIEGGDALASKCEIRATPTLFMVSRRDFTVIDYNLEGGVEWILSQLEPSKTPIVR